MWTPSSGESRQARPSATAAASPIDGQSPESRRSETACFDVYEFIAAVLDHLPAPHQQMVRYWGRYANASRGKRRAAARGADHELGTEQGTATLAALAAAPAEEPPYRRRSRLTWAALIRKVTPCCAPTAAPK